MEKKAFNNDEMKAIFLDTKDGKSYTKVWGGLTFNIEKLPDGSLKVKAHEQDTEITTPKTYEDGGFYWVCNVYEGKGFITFKPSKDGDGDYCLLKLTAETRLPRNPANPAPAKGGYAKKPAAKKAYSKAPAQAAAKSPW